MLFNKYMEEEKENIRKGAEKYKIIETDHYQGNIKMFIMDLTEMMMEDIRENIQIQNKKITDELEDKLVI